MKQIISTEKVPIKLWLSNIEDGALAQARNVAKVMQDQQDLVEIHMTLSPLAVING